LDSVFDQNLTRGNDDVFFLRLFTLLRGSYHHIAGKVGLGILITATFVGQALAVAAGLKIVFYQKSLDGLGLLLLTIHCYRP